MICEINFIFYFSFLQKKLQEYCYFYETMVNGWHRFHSATDDTKHIGFTRNGRAIRFHNRTTRPYENCYNFVKIDRSNINFTTDKSTTAIQRTTPTPFTFKNSSTTTTTTIGTINVKPKSMHTPLSEGRNLQANRIGKKEIIFFLIFIVSHRPEALHRASKC